MRTLKFQIYLPDTIPVEIGNSHAIKIKETYNCFLKMTWNLLVNIQQWPMFFHLNQQFSKILVSWECLKECENIPS